MRGQLYIAFLLLFISNILFANEKDSSSYTIYKQKLVLYSDLGYRSSPFSIKYQFTPEIDKIKFKHNLRTIMGVGFHYKWLAFRVGFSLPGTIRPPSKYGNSKHINLGVQFSVKRTFIDLDLRYDSGYVVMNAYRWNDSLTPEYPNDLSEDIRSANLSANVWYFKNKNFHMKPVLGRVGHYNKEVKTFYLKSTLNFFGAGNNSGILIPPPLRDSLKDKTRSKSVTALDLGVVPGFAYVNRINNWQFSFFTGLGGVIQSKFYTTPLATRGFLGIAPRVDVRFIGGYNDPKYFCHLATEFDIKSIRFQKFKYNQIYYSLQVVGGIRLNTGKKKSRRKD